MICLYLNTRCRIPAPRTQNPTSMKEPRHIVFIGDSLTEWFDFDHYFPGIAIINEGIAGDTSYGVLERIDDIMLRPAEKIFLMIGINDIFNGFLKEDIVENQQLIIEEIQTQSTQSELIVQSLLPVNESMLGSPDYLNKLIRYINKELKNQCNALNITYLDLYNDFILEGELKQEYTTDGGHLSEEGYKLWAKKLQAFPL
jgi:lysophospholipase L1-like esterase